MQPLSPPGLPPLEVALELPGDRLAARLGQLGGVLGLLEVADVLRDVLVLLGELGDAALPGPGLLGQVAERDADLEQVLDLGEQGQRGLRARRLRRGSAGRPPRTTPRAGRAGAGVLEHADDAGRSFVGRRLELEPVTEVELGGGAGDLDRPGVRGLGQQRAERDDQLDTEVVGAASSSAQNWRHFMFGSMPRSSTTSRCEPGGEATDSCVDGQVMRRMPSSVVPTRGRLTWKS